MRDTSDTRQWLPQSRCGEAATLGCDRNGDLIPQFNELGPSIGYNLGTSNRYADGYDWPNANEYTVEAAAAAPGQPRGFRRLYAPREAQSARRSATWRFRTNTYIQLSVTEATSGQAVTVYNQDPALRGRIDTLWDNDSRNGQHV